MFILTHTHEEDIVRKNKAYCQALGFIQRSRSRFHTADDPAMIESQRLTLQEIGPALTDKQLLSLIELSQKFVNENRPLWQPYYATAFSLIVQRTDPNDIMFRPDFDHKVVKVTFGERTFVLPRRIEHLSPAAQEKIGGMALQCKDAVAEVDKAFKALRNRAAEEAETAELTA